MNKIVQSAVDVTCPNCGTSIPVAEVLHKQITDRCEAQLAARLASHATTLAAREADVRNREALLQASEAQVDAAVRTQVAIARAELEKQLKASAWADIELEMTDLRTAAAERDERVRQLQQSELQLRQEKRQLLEDKQCIETSIDQQVRDRLGAEREAVEQRVTTVARRQARREIELELADLQSVAAEKDDQLKEAQKIELDLRKQKRDLEEQRYALGLEVTRRIDVERASIRETAIREFEEARQLKDAERDLRFQEVIKANDDLRRKLQQGSQQSQGEVLETTLEDLLRATFPLDLIEPVAKGVRGADVLQRVYTRSGYCCGTVVWESKNTKNWSDGWVEKLKDDQRDAGADIAVLVSTALPKDVTGFAFRQGIWLSEARLVSGLATALRNGLIEIALTKRAVAGKNEAVEVLFAYLTGAEFRQRVEAVVRTFSDMQGDLAEERRAAARRWTKREKQIARVIESTSGMYGGLQGLLGSAMPTIPALADHSEQDAEDESARDGAGTSRAAV